MKLDDAQFAILIEKLGSEPDTNWWSAQTLIGGAILFLAFVEYWRTNRKNNVDLILTSWRDYESLYEPLLKLKEIEKEYGKYLVKNVDTTNLDEGQFIELNAKIISDEDWGKVRKIKMFYKSRFDLRKKWWISRLISGIFSDYYLAKSMDQYGNSSLGFVKVLDYYRFYTVRKGEYNKEELDLEKLKEKLDRDNQWYDELQKFMKKMGATHG